MRAGGALRIGRIERAKERADLFKPDVEAAAAPDEVKARFMRLAVLAVVVLEFANGGRQQADAFVVSNGFGRIPGDSG